jgi:hypothetical protein
MFLRKYYKNSSFIEKLSLNESFLAKRILIVHSQCFLNPPNEKRDVIFSTLDHMISSYKSYPSSFTGSIIFTMNISRDFEDVFL